MVAGGKGVGRYYALWVRVLFFSVVACIRIIYCHWRRWVYEPGLKSDVNIIFLTFDIIRYRYSYEMELAEARLSWRALTPSLSSARSGYAWLCSGLVCFNCSANCTDLKGVKKLLFSFCL